MPQVHEDPYPSRPAMEAAVSLEIQNSIGLIQTQTIGKMVQRVVDAAVAAERQRCAKIAEDCDRGPYRGGITGSAIADKIRRAPAPEGR